MIQSTNRVFLVLGSTDMRKSFDTLAAVVTAHDFNPLSGDLYVFASRNRSRFKVLVWEKGGYWVCARRLETGTIAIPSADTTEHCTVEISLIELRLLIEGIELRQIKKSKRFDAGNLQK